MTRGEEVFLFHVIKCHLPEVHGEGREWARRSVSTVGNAGCSRKGWSRSLESLFSSPWQVGWDCARVKLDVCMHRMMHTISWALWEWMHQPAPKGRCSPRVWSVAGAHVLWWLCSIACSFLEQCWGIPEMPAGVNNSSSVLGAVLWLEARWPGQEVSGASEKLPWAKEIAKSEAPSSSGMENVLPGKIWSQLIEIWGQ